MCVLIIVINFGINYLIIYHCLSIALAWCDFSELRDLAKKHVYKYRPVVKLQFRIKKKLIYLIILFFHGASPIQLFVIYFHNSSSIELLGYLSEKDSPSS